MSKHQPISRRQLFQTPERRPSFTSSPAAEEGDYLRSNFLAEINRKRNGSTIAAPARLVPALPVTSSHFQRSLGDELEALRCSPDAVRSLMHGNAVLEFTGTLKTESSGKSRTAVLQTQRTTGWGSFDPCVLRQLRLSPRSVPEKLGLSQLHFDGIDRVIVAVSSLPCLNFRERQFSLLLF